jgi:hypothetical protein
MFTPSATAVGRQRVCGEDCRRARRRELARRRRAADLDGYRADEVERQRAHRAKARDARITGGCHAPASRPNLAKVQPDVARFVDRALALSRTSLLRDLRQIVGGSPEFVADTG